MWSLKILIFVLFAKTVESISPEAGRNTVGVLTLYSSIVFFVFSVVTFVISLLSFFKNRRLRHFQLTEPRTHTYYNGKDKNPKLRRKVLEAFDRGGSIHKRPDKTNLE